MSLRFAGLSKTRRACSTGAGSAAPHSLLVALLAIAVSILTAPVLAAAQVENNEVHILPRVIPSNDSRPVFRASSDLVLVNVTVLDHAGHTVSGLADSQFAVQEDRHPQRIRYVSNEDAPLSMVVVLDASASMAPKLQEARAAFAKLAKTSNPEDEFSLIVVGDNPHVVLHLDESSTKIERLVDTLQPQGATALWDGIYLGTSELKNARYRRKAMVVISDGGDNHSRYTLSEIRSLLQESDIEVYAIGMFNPYATRIEEKRGALQLDELTSVTGGRVISAHDSGELSRAAIQISRELRNQYVLGYYSTNHRRDGRLRKVKVRLTSSGSQSSFRLYAKNGYLAPIE